MTKRKTEREKEREKETGATLSVYVCDHDRMAKKKRKHGEKRRKR